MTWQIWLGTAAQAEQTISSGIFSHLSRRAIFRALVFWWGFLQALLSKMDHIEKSIGLRSGLEGAHIDLSQKDGNTNFQKSWTKTAVCWCTILHECIRLVPICVLEPWDNLGFKHVFVDPSIELDPNFDKD